MAKQLGRRTSLLAVKVVITLKSLNVLLLCQEWPLLAWGNGDRLGGLVEAAVTLYPFSPPTRLGA